MRPYGKAEMLERRRMRAIELVNKGRYSQVGAAKELGVNPRSVRLWMYLYRREGVAGLRSKPTPGRPCRLDGKLKKRLEKILLRGAKSAGYGTDLWTCPRVMEVIQREFGVRYHVDHIGKLLHLLGFTPQKPQRRAVERDEEEIRSWIRVQWPRIKKKPRN